MRGKRTAEDAPPPKSPGAATAVAERAAARGKADGEDTTRFEKRLAEIKAGKR